MRHAFNHHFQRCENEWEFIERPGSPPIVSNLPKNIYISLSHSNGLICLAISGSPIGIDIEAATKHRDFLTLAKTIMSDDEVNYYVQNASTHADLFYRMWCAKEAAAKSLGVGLNGRPSLVLVKQFNENGQIALVESQGIEIPVAIQRCDENIIAIANK